MNLDHKSKGEKMQLMIKKRSHLPVKKRMTGDDDDDEQGAFAKIQPLR